MDNNTPAEIRKRELPEWNIDQKGRQRLGGRWNMQRISEFLIANPTWQTVDDLSRIVYGLACKMNRDNVRKHIPAQRRFMLNQIECPIVTQYGERGRIMRIKLYNKADDLDRVSLKMELDRARDRKEVSDKRYEDLLNIFLLPSPD